MTAKLDDFIPAEFPGVFCAPGKNAADFTYSDSDAAENEILEILKAAEDKSSCSAELESKIHNWTTKYHLSILRSNIIRSLDFISPESRILEIGAGCGAVTRFLGEKFASVDAVEGSYRRSCITRERCRDLNNVRVFSSPLQDISFEKEYDVVMLIGVLEWAPMFYPGEGPENSCLAMLKHAVSALKDNGILITAIENKLGLKYWSGCREDHSGAFFDSIHGYPRDNTPVTFSKHELTGLMGKADLCHHQFYYPFPDYKLANTILREIPDPCSYFLHNWLTEPFEDNFGNRNYHFQEGLAIRSLEKAGLLYEFANSFLIASSFNSTALKKAEDAGWVARRYSNSGRISAFKTITELKFGKTDGKLAVMKQRLNDVPAPEGPVFQTVSNAEWVPGDLLQFELFESLYKDNPLDCLINSLQKYHDRLIEDFSKNQNDGDGYPLLEPNAMDFVPFNIVCNQGNLQAIDLEWIASGTVTADYMLFRVLSGFSRQQAPFIFLKIPLPDDDIDAFFISIIQKFYPQYNLARQLVNKQQEETFQSFVVGRQVKLPSSEDCLRAKETPEQLQLLNMLNSWSWRITAPLRWCRRLLMKRKH